MREYKKQLNYIYLIIVFYISGCTEFVRNNDLEELTPTAPLIHERTSKIKFLGCDKHFYTQNLTGIQVKNATANYIYALISSNTYRVNNKFKIPEYKYIKHYRDDKSGFQADIYKNKKNKEIIISFRGSDDIKDWRLVNNVIAFRKKQKIPKQYDYAISITKDIIRNNNGFTITLTGHSLGGSLANHVSWKTKLKSITFNTSPRLWVNKNDLLLPPSIWIDIKEKGDPLHEFPIVLFGKMERVFFENNNGKIYPYEFDFVEDHKNINFLGISLNTEERDHNIYYLARGLLLAAASSGNKMANQILKINVGC